MTIFDKYADAAREYIDKIDYPSAPQALYDPIRYTMADGGKRLRPLFVLGACGLWRDDVTDALPAAAAIEMFHNFTLVHDDIMDNAPLRRGRESVFRRWGTNVATLSGDALMICSYRQLALTRAEILPRVMEHFNEAAVRVCEGQQFDMDFESCEQVSAAEHLAMIELKTAALFVGAVSMGAVVGGASEAQVARLREFALQFGVAFQMQDDLLDSYGDARLGKTVGGDILEGKKTFLKMQALASAGGAASGSGSSAVSAASGGAASASADDRAELELIHKDLRFSSEEKIARVLSLYERYGVRESVEREISRRFAAAAAALDSLAGEASGTAGTAVGASSAGGVDPARLAAFKSFALSQLGRTK